LKKNGVFSLTTPVKKLANKPSKIAQRTPEALKRLEITNGDETPCNEEENGKRLAGYSENVATQSIVDSLEEEIYTLTQKYISRIGVKAAVAMNHVIENPTDLGNKEKMQAAKDILDRAGYKPKDKVEVETKDPLFILPAKKEDNAESE